MRTMIFVDFWNFQLNWNDYWRKHNIKEIVKIPWKEKMPAVLIDTLGDDAVYVGTKVFASINKTKEKDRKLSTFLNVMDGFPGYKVSIKERKSRGHLNCPECKKFIKECPHCKKEIHKTIEKGVDAALSVALIKLGLDDVYDKAILVSADADYIPAVEFIQEKGKHVINLGFRREGYDIRNACWDHKFIDDLMEELTKE